MLLQTRNPVLDQSKHLNAATHKRLEEWRNLEAQLFLCSDPTSACPEWKTAKGQLYVPCLNSSYKAESWLEWILRPKRGNQTERTEPSFKIKKVSRQQRSGIVVSAYRMSEQEQDIRSVLVVRGGVRTLAIAACYALQQRWLWCYGRQAAYF